MTVPTGTLVASLESPGTPGDPLFFDDFNYAVSRDASDKSAFLSRGWTDVKSEPAQTGAEGYLYTVTAIPDLNLAWPNGIARALCLEVPTGIAQQTDFYLQISGGANYIPGNVWFQWWHLTARTATQPSQIHARNKWLYPSNNDYPSSTNRWLFEPGSQLAEPNMNLAPYGNPSNGEQYLSSRDNMVGTVDYTAASEYPTNANKLGQTTLTELIQPNRWQLVKVHYDTSAASNNAFEAWIKPYGGAWTKVAEWIGGTTPNFTWTQADGGGGHSALRMPTTIPGNNVAVFLPQWHYMQDFAMAASEADLPTY